MTLQSFKIRIYDLWKKKIVKHTLSMLASRSLGILIQGAYFTIVARTLGVHDYGLFIGVCAFVGILTPYSGLGFGQILIANVARNPALFKEYWGNAIFMNVTSGILLTALTILAGDIFLPKTAPLIIILLIALADLIFYKVYKVAIHALNSLELIHWIAKCGFGFRLTGLIAALCLSTFFGNSGIIAWAILYLAIRVITALWTSLLVCQILGRPKLALSRIPIELKEGFYFSIGSSSTTIYNDVDKSMLARMSSLEATGMYGAAYRIVSVAVTPVLSIMASTYAKFFQQGKDGIIGSLKLAKFLVPITGLYGAVASLSLIVFAPLIPYILGSEYSNSINAVRWLAPLIFLKSVQYLAADTLTGAGFQGLRSAVQVAIAVFNTVANLWLIPLYSWKGAVWSSLASDGLLVIVLWTLAFYISQRQQEQYQ